MIGLDSVWLALAALQDRVLAGPTLDRGTVLSNGSVQLDSDSTPLATLPWVLGAPLVSGQRVLSIAWKGYRAVIGSASVPPVPPGSIQAWAGITAVPAGWLISDGRVMNIADYPALAAVLGTRYGGNGTTTFGLPDMRGRMPVGQNTGTFNYISGTGGVETVTLTEAQLPAHDGHIDGYTGTLAAYLEEPGGLTSYTDTGHGWKQYRGNEIYPYHFARGSGQSHANMPPYIVLNYLIKT